MGVAACSGRSGAVVTSGGNDGDWCSEVAE